MTRPPALWGAAPLAVGLCDRGPAASRATQPSDHRTDRLHTGERLLGARRHPLDDAADRAPAVPDDPDDEACARPRVTGRAPSHPLTRWPDPIWGCWDGSPQADAARGFDARPAAGAPVNLRTKKAQALLAYLGLRLGQPHSRDTLAAPLLDEDPLSTFAKNSW
jgi:hypothetical protein